MYTKYTGIILKKHPLGEADELLTIYTREAGKVRVKSVSSRKIQSKLGNYLHSLNEIEFETARSSRAVAYSGALPILTSVRTKTINNYLRQNLKKFATALVGAETLYRITPDRQVSTEAYEALVKFLKDLGESHEENFCLRGFQLQILKILGFGLDVGQQPLGEDSRRQFELLLAGGPAVKLYREVELTIEDFLNYVLEREIKSAKFLSSL